MQTMKTIYNRLDKEYIKDLPLVSFPGKIITVNSEREADKAVPFLLSKDILGVDTETRPSFKKGQQHKVSLLQVATEDICFLFRLNYIGMVTPVISLLSNTDVPMVGLSWHDDLAALAKVDITTDAPLLDTIETIGDMIDEICRLTDEL